MKKIRLAIVSLGCNKTFVDTENLVGELFDKIDITPEKDAEFILLNTCSFLKSARDEALENLDNLSNKKIILVGCYTAFAKNDIFDKYPQVWAVVPSSKYDEISSAFDKVLSGKRVYFDFEIEDKYLELKNSVKLTLPHVAYVKISEGCDNTCSYCTIPKIRGKFRSRDLENIISEIEDLVSRGCKEIILTSQDTGYYGNDKGGIINYKGLKFNFVKLLKEIVKINGNFIVRFLYMYPERISNELLDLVAGSSKIMPYFDIPFQHASKSVLIGMKRPFGHKLLGGLVEKIKSKIPNAVIRTTFIVGFPGETDEDFEMLSSFIKKYKLERIGVFKYSNEKGSESYKHPDQVPEEVKQDRFEKLSALAEEISFENNKSLVDNGEELDVLIDGYDKIENLWICRSYRECLEVDPLIYVSSEKSHNIGDSMKVKIEECDEYDLYGTQVS